MFGSGRMLFSISRVAGKPSKSAQQRSGRRWTIAELEQLGRLSDTELARKYGRTIKEVAAEREARRIGLDLGPRPWTERENKQLGKSPDRDVAQRLRRSKGSVAQQRRQLKIAAFQPRGEFRMWRPDELVLLGTKPDDELAIQLNRTISSVRAERHALGIR